MALSKVARKAPVQQTFVRGLIHLHQDQHRRRDLEWESRGHMNSGR